MSSEPGDWINLPLAGEPKRDFLPNYKQVDILPTYTFGPRRESPVTRYIQESGVWFPQSSERWYSYSPITGTLRAYLKMNAADCSLFLRENKMNPDHKKGHRRFLSRFLIALSVHQKWSGLKGRQKISIIFHLWVKQSDGI